MCNHAVNETHAENSKPRKIRTLLVPLIVAVVMILLSLSNPKEETHRSALKENQTWFERLVDTLLKDSTYHSYIFYSVTKDSKGKTLAVGVAGKVYVLKEKSGKKSKGR